MLLELTTLGLSFDAARRLGVEEMLCLLAHSALQRELDALQAEATRIASLPFADSHEQQRELYRLRHRAAACQARFYRDVQ